MTSCSQAGSFGAFKDTRVWDETGGFDEEDGGESEDLQSACLLPWKMSKTPLIYMLLQ